MDKNNSELDDILIIILKNEDGIEEEFYLIAQFDYMDAWYVALEPVKKTKEIGEGDLMFMEMSQDSDENDVFLPILDVKLVDELFTEFLNVQSECDKE